MKVAISFLGTGKYLDFLPNYYENIEKYFLPNTEKTILAFTDGEIDDTPENLKVFSQEHLDWRISRSKDFTLLTKQEKKYLITTGLFLLTVMLSSLIG